MTQGENSMSSFLIERQQGVMAYIFSLSTLGGGGRKNTKVEVSLVYTERLCLKKGGKKSWVVVAHSIDASSYEAGKSSSPAWST